MRVCLIINPAAGQSGAGASLARLRERLSWSAGLEVRETARRGDAERFAGEVREGEFDLVAVGGGDGTLNEVVNGLNANVPLGILPLGTANVLARELRIPIANPAAACALLRDGEPRPIDLGWCSGRRFLLMAGIGFDAEVVKEVPPNVKDLIGAPAYVLTGLHALTQVRPIRYRLQMPHRRYVTRAMVLVVANAASYGGPLQLAPHARIDDGVLDLCLFRERSRLAFLGQWLRVLLRRQRKDPRFAYFRADEVRVDCRPPASVQLDGDYFGRTPVEIRVLPGAVRVVQPPLG